MEVCPSTKVGAMRILRYAIYRWCYCCQFTCLYHFIFFSFTSDVSAAKTTKRNCDGQLLTRSRNIACAGLDACKLIWSGPYGQQVPDMISLQNEHETIFAVIVSWWEQIRFKNWKSRQKWSLDETLFVMLTYFNSFMHNQHSRKLLVQVAKFEERFSTNFFFYDWSNSRASI